jgi:DNA-binding ferritin-like protein (Dps family)
MEGYLLYEKDLSGEYKETFKMISAYVSAELVDEVTASNYLTELLDSFLNAQHDGRPVESIVGNDIESFCRNFCADFTYKERLYKIWDYMNGLAWVVFWLSVVDMLDAQSSLFAAESSSNISGYIIAALFGLTISSIFDMVSTHIMFRHKKINPKIIVVLSGLLAVAMFAVYILIFNRKILDISLTMPAFAPAAAAACFLIIYYIGNRKRRKAYKENSVSIWKTDTQSLAADLEVQMEKKRLKKNMEPEAFLEKEMRETEKLEVFGKFEWIVYVLVTVVFLAVQMPSMETVFDGVVYVMIIAAIEFIVYRAVHSFFAKVVDRRKKWAQNYRAKM